MRADSDHGLNSSRPTSHQDPVTDVLPSHGPTVVGDGGVPNSRPYPPTSTSACKRARMHQSNAWFDSTTGRPVRASSALTAPAARNRRKQATTGRETAFGTGTVRPRSGWSREGHAGLDT